MRAPGILAAVFLAAGTAGCGSTSSSASSASSSSSAPAASSSASSSQGSASAGTLTLSEKEYKILPAAPTLGHTGKVTITVKNTGAITHAFTIDTPSGPVRASTIAPGATATLTVDLKKPGHYTFFCPIPGHRQAGMVGTLIVEPTAHAASGAGSGGAAVSGGSSASSGY